MGITRVLTRAVVALAALIALAAPAGAVQVTTGAGSGLAGQNVDITISCSNTTGLGIVSLQFDLNYNSSVVTAVDVLEATTLTATAGWPEAQFQVTSVGASGKVSVSQAGATALASSGALIRVRFLINPAQLAASSSPLTLANWIFNEGTPNDTTSNATLTINATPIITVSPNTGEVIRQQTLRFTVSGSVTNPVSWFTTNASVATISATGLLTGVAPGDVRVFAVDNAGRRDTTDGVVTIRGMGLTAGSGSVVQGQSITIPLTVTTLTGLGIRAGQVRLNFNGGLLTATGVTTPGGTLLSGYGPVGFGASSGTCTVDFAGSTDLAGAGVLCNVTFASNAAASGTATLTVAQALFNEVLPAKTTNGSVSVTAVPTITVNPDNVTLLAGQQQQFTLAGSPTPPIQWSVLNPAVASINAAGMLTALAGGVTQVRAEDAVGAVDVNTSLTVYDFRATVGTVAAPPGAQVHVPITADRSLGALGIYSLQYTLQWTGTSLTSATTPTLSGLIGTWAPNVLTQSPSATQHKVVAAGAAPLPGGQTDIAYIDFQISPAAAPGTNVPITLVSLLCNEGAPSAQLVSGVVQVRTTADATPVGGLALALAPPEPNPVRGACRLRFTVPSTGASASRVRLAIFGADGRRVRGLLDGLASAGVHDVSWDGRDALGRPVAAGLYFVRLEWNDRVLGQRIAFIR